MTGELRGHDGNVRSVRRTLEPTGERRPQRTEQHVVELDQPTRHDDELGIEDVRQTDEPERDLQGVLGDQLDRIGGTRLGGVTHVDALDRVGVAARLREHRRCGSGGGAGPTHRPERGTGRDGFPVPPLAAGTPRPVGIDLEVPDLRTEAVRTPQHFAPGDDTPADAGAERDEQHLPVPPGRPVGELRHRGDVGVVVDDGGQADGRLQARPHRRVTERGHVGRVVDDTVVVDHARGADAERPRPGTQPGQRAHRVVDGGHDAVEGVGRGHSSLFDDGPVGIDDRNPQVRATEVDTERRGGRRRLVAHRQASPRCWRTTRSAASINALAASRSASAASST